jgi:hypothetical protein
MLRVGFERNYESGIPGCGMYLREKVVSGFPGIDGKGFRVRRRFRNV